MKIAYSAICALLIFGTVGVALAQAPDCPPARQPQGPAPATGNASSLNPAMNAETDVPKGSPLEGLPNPFKTEFDWAKMPAGRVWGDDRAIAIDKDGVHIWVADRCGLNEGICGKDKTINSVMEFDRSGNLVKSFGAGMLQSPHGIDVDPEGNIWVSDGGPRDGCQPEGQPAGNRLTEFSTSGKMIRQIKGPIDGKPFQGLNGVAFDAKTGDIFLADGHGGNYPRVIRFDKNGKYILSWGGPGKEDDHFGIVHDITIDHEGRVYVADRSGVAVKVFTEDGKLLNVWHQFGEPSGVYVDKNDLLYVADETATIPVRNPNLSPGVRIATLDGKIIANVPYRQGNALEGVAVDKDGNIYGGNTNHPRSVRFMKTGPLPNGK